MRLFRRLVIVVTAVSMLSSTLAVAGGLPHCQHERGHVATAHSCHGMAHQQHDKAAQHTVEKSGCECGCPCAGQCGTGCSSIMGTIPGAHSGFSTGAMAGGYTAVSALHSEEHHSLPLRPPSIHSL